MSDAEHELFVDNAALRDDVARLHDLVLRALTTAIYAQDAAFGHHDVWLDQARDELSSQPAHQRR